MKRIILASGSPRRKELLSLLEKEFEVHVSDVDESCDLIEPAEVVTYLSQIKAKAVQEELHTTNAIIIAADTIVSVDGKILGKPKDAHAAYEMISALAGRSHQVLTGVTILSTGEDDMVSEDTFYCLTSVRVGEMTQQEIADYISTDEPYDKAGGYGIQGIFAKHITAIEGDYYNVVGLPVAMLYEHLKKIGERDK